jgi:hypothetical protein
MWCREHVGVEKSFCGNLVCHALARPIAAGIYEPGKYLARPSPAQTLVAGLGHSHLDPPHRSERCQTL